MIGIEGKYQIRLRLTWIYLNGRRRVSEQRGDKTLMVWEEQFLLCPIFSVVNDRGDHESKAQIELFARLLDIICS